MNIRTTIAGALLVMLACASVCAADPPADPSMGGDQIASRSEYRYTIPDVTLVREDGRRVSLRHDLNDGRPVVMNFIYTSCTTICPMSSQLFERFQQALGAQRRAVHLVSISIDPEEDTPARLRAYARKFHAEPGWDHYTGSAEAVIEVQRVFSVYHGDKMGHTPLTLMRQAPGRPWVRYDGFATPEQLLAETRGWNGATHLARAAP
jgi:protein SCO1